MIYVTSYWQLEEHAFQKKPEWLVSILGPNDRLPWPVNGNPGNRLRVECDDIQYPCSGFVVPTTEHVESLIAFLKRWNGKGSMMIHCKAGTSRSPAAALIALRILNPGKEKEAALLLRREAPQAKPSEVFLRHADTLLGGDNKLVSAARMMPAPDRIAETDLISLEPVL